MISHIKHTCVFCDADVTGHGNDMMPGFAQRAIPDKVTIDVERFQCVLHYAQLDELMGYDVSRNTLDTFRLMTCVQVHGGAVPATSHRA